MAEFILWTITLLLAFGLPAAILRNATDPIQVMVGYLGLGVLPVAWLFALGASVA